jgi:C4-dicarboxylate-specific signal transduction histidine kinase
VRKLLVFSQEPAPTGARPSVPLAEVVRDTVRWLPATLPSGVKVRAALPAGNTNVAAHLSELHQVIVGLVTNAWYALEDPYRGQIDVAVVPDGERLQLVVSTGSSAAGVGDATDLPPVLAGVDEIARSMGGSIQVRRGEPGAGDAANRYTVALTLGRAAG